MNESLPHASQLRLLKCVVYLV